MQVFVKKSQIALAILPVAGIFPDSPMVDRDVFGGDYTVLTLPPEEVTTDLNTKMMQLIGNWRINVAMIINAEAQRRITEAFTDFMQRNCTNVNTQNIVLYGTDKSIWPAGSQDQYDACEVGWVYIAAVRAQSDALLVSGIPPGSDPTADANWPLRIAPVYVEL